MIKFTIKNVRSNIEKNSAFFEKVIKSKFTLILYKDETTYISTKTAIITKMLKGFVVLKKLAIISNILYFCPVNILKK